jgi:histidyl-tRNA synthetase
MTEKKLSVESYKGTRDFYPEDMAVQKYLFKKMRETVESFGYVEYGASILEETELYRAKSGEEIVNEQTYTFEDRGGRDVTIRPEMTPTVARMIAKRRKELVFPLRWYSIPNLFRYERPQRGRLREHWQLNVDLFGVDNISADIEAIQVAHTVMSSFGAKDSDFVIRVNSRKLSNYFLQDYIGANEETAYTLSKLIDRKDKMKAENFVEEVRGLLADDADKFMEFLNTNNLSELSDEFKALPVVQELQQLFTTLQERGITNAVYDPIIMRGFDYYTGVVFELHDVSPENNRSLFGGGRYDDLVGLFDVEKVPGVGFGMGDVTIKDFLDSHGLSTSDTISTTDIYLCLLGEEFEKHAQELAAYLRKQGIRVEIDISRRKIASQIKTADKHGVPYIVCIGENEQNEEIYKLKKLVTGEEIEVVREKMVEVLKEVYFLG